MLPLATACGQSFVAQSIKLGANTGWTIAGPRPSPLVLAASQEPWPPAWGGMGLVAVPVCPKPLPHYWCPHKHGRQRRRYAQAHCQSTRPPRNKKDKLPVQQQHMKKKDEGVWFRSPLLKNKRLGSAISFFMPKKYSCRPSRFSFSVPLRRRCTKKGNR